MGGGEGSARAAQEEIERLRTQVDLLGNYDKTRGQLAQSVAQAQQQVRQLEERLAMLTSEWGLP